jgi:hypothetical protein
VQQPSPAVGLHTNQIAVSAAAALSNLEAFSALTQLAPSPTVTLHGDADSIVSAIARLGERLDVKSAVVTLRPKGGGD